MSDHASNAELARLRRIEAAARATLADYLGDDAVAGEWPTMDALGEALDETIARARAAGKPVEIRLPQAVAK